MTLVAGVDSSTQSCKVLICDAESGQVVRSGRAPHPSGTEVHPDHWWHSFQKAAAEAGGLDDVAAISVGGQQHGMVLLDSTGVPVREALLWNDTRSAAAAEQLIADLASADQTGEQAWANRVGLVPVASFTASKLRWVADNEPENMARAAAVCLPHDWLSWKIASGTDISQIRTDRSDASGTAYFAAHTDSYDMDLLRLSTRGRELVVPEVIQFGEPAHTSGVLFVGAGMGDNAAAAEGVGIEAGDILVSLGTSGVVTAITADRPMDESGVVAGFAAARPGLFLPLACTLNGAELFDSYARLLGVSLDELAELALSAEPKSAGVVTVPYFNGERTPNLPNARGSLTGLSLANFTAENLARSLVEGLLQGLAFAMDSVSASSAGKVYMVGGAAKSRAVREIAPVIFGRPVVFLEPAEYVALGAAKQASELVREQNS